MKNLELLREALLPRPQPSVAEKAPRNFEIPDSTQAGNNNLQQVAPPAVVVEAQASSSAAEADPTPGPSGIRMYPMPPTPPSSSESSDEEADGEEDPEDSNNHDDDDDSDASGSIKIIAEFVKDPRQRARHGQAM